MFVILQLLLDVVGSTILELVLEFTRVLNTERDLRPAAVVWLVVLGLCGGVLSGAIAPDRVLRPGPFRGVSLVVVPAVLAAAMHLCGSWRSRHDATISHLATWYGGTAFGIGLAGGRLAVLAFASEVWKV